jgi:hypothetical protein
MRGIDYAWSHPSAASIKAAGIGFVARYLSHDLTKDISLPEKNALSGAGIAIVVVFEATANRVLSGYSGGVADAQTANDRVNGLGMPGIPIYFACDFDASASQQAAINAYLKGAASVIGLARVGLYGGYWPLDRARAAGLATYFWGTYAWSGSNWGSCGWKPHIMQAIPTINIGGVTVDSDTSNFDDFGQWPRKAEPDMPLTSTDIAAIVNAIRFLRLDGQPTGPTISGVLMRADAALPALKAQIAADDAAAKTQVASIITALPKALDSAVVAAAVVAGLVSAGFTADEIAGHILAGLPADLASDVVAAMGSKLSAP